MLRRLELALFRLLLALLLGGVGRRTRLLRPAAALAARMMLAPGDNPASGGGFNDGIARSIGLGLDASATSSQT